MIIITRRQSVLVLLAVTALCHSAAWAADTGAGSGKGNADKLFAAGVEVQRRAAAATSPTEAWRGFQQAIEYYRQSAELRSDFYNAYGKWSQALLELALLAADSDRRWRYVEEASEQFAVCAKCRGVDWVTYRTWADMLMFRIGELSSTTEQRHVILTEAQRAYAAALPLARFANQRAELHYKIGIGLGFLADASNDDSERRRYYEQAANSFEAAIQEKSTDALAASYEKWGVCLVMLGKLSKDTELIRRAVEKYQVAIERDPHKPDAHYNLGCAFALLEQSDDAIRALRLCVENDPGARYQPELARDPDLAPLRSRADFQLLLEMKSAPAEVSRLFASGLAFQQAAEKTDVAGDAVTNYQRAIAQYRLALNANRDFYHAHFMWADCLLNLARRDADASHRRQFLQQSREHFADAARCPDADATVYQAWGEMVLNDCGRLETSVTGRRANLAEAKRIFESGLATARYGAERCRFKAGLGNCLTQTAELTTDIKGRLDLYTQAVAQFNEAFKASVDAMSPSAYVAWGFALLQIGKFNHDHLVIRQGVDRLSTAAEKDSTNAETHYNLACAYALLSSPAAAVKHLRLCFANDSRHKYVKLAGRDADLKSVRDRGDFLQMVEEFARKDLGREEPAPATKN